MTKEQFQKQHGEQWAGIVNNPAFLAAMQLCSGDKLKRMATITDAEIAAHGTAILADFRGHLQHENALIDLAVETTDTVFDLPPETYQSSEEQASEPRRKKR